MRVSRSNLRGVSMNKSVCLLLVCAVIVSLSAPRARAASFFSDTEGCWAEESIAILRARGLVMGYEDGLFRPERHVSRAEAAKVVVMLLGWQEEADALARSQASSRYEDMRSGHWAFGYVEMASDLGLFIGDERGWFRPEASITRAELITVLGRVLGRLQDPSADDLPFLDADEIPWWAVPSLHRVVEVGMLPVGVDESFSPRDVIDRSMFVDYMRKYMRYCGCDFDLMGDVRGFDRGVLELQLPQRTLNLDIRALVSFRNGQRGDPRPYDQAGIIVDGEGRVLHVSSFFMGVEGTLLSRSGNHLTVVREDGSIRDYTVQSDALVFRHAKEAFLSDLRVDDELLLVLDYRDGTVRAVDAVALDKWGLVSSVSAGGRVVVVQRDHVADLLLLNEVTLLFWDGRPAVMEDIQEGMLIRYREGGQYVEYAELSFDEGGDSSHD